jgi:O-antigen/teichoic acid export membrane protein
VKNNFLKNGFYNVFAGIIRIGLAILTIPLLIRLIGVEEYGLWTLASTIILVVALAEAGIAVTTTVFVSQDLDKGDVESLSQTLTVTIGGILILATFASLTLYFTADSIVSLFSKLDQSQHLAVVHTLQLGCLVVWCRLLQLTLIGAEQAYQQYRLLNILSTIQSFSLNLGLVGIAWLGGRTVELMQWQVLISILILIGHIWIVRSLVQHVRLRPIWNKGKVLAIADYSFTVWLLILGTALFSKGDRLIVGYYLGSESLGIYGGVTEIASAINSFSALPVQPLVPILSGYSKNHNISHSELTQKIKQAIELNTFFALGSAAFLFILSPFIMRLMFVEVANENTLIALQIAIVIYGLFSLNAVGFFILISNDPKTVMRIQLISGIFALTLIFLGASKFGLLGAISGNIGFILTWLMIFCGLKNLKISNLLWLKSSFFLLVWFATCILGKLLIPQLEFLIVFSIIQVIIIVSYIINIFSKELNLLLYKIVSRKN